MKKEDFLLEIGCEELPHHKQQSVIDHFAHQLSLLLDSMDIHVDRHKTFASPRRLAVIFKGVCEIQQDQVIEKKGPSVANGFDDSGQPTKALLGFCQSLSITPEELDRVETPKGKWLIYKGVKQGKITQEILPELIQEAWKKTPLGKCMVWSETASAFPRPVRWICALWGKQTLALSLFGLESSHFSYGHRIHAPESINIASPECYEKTLEKAYVIADTETRKSMITQFIKSYSKKNHHVILDQDLIDEVTGLVEWPVVMQGHFSDDFLALPKEVLMTSMKKNQKYFAVEASDHSLLPTFLTVANIESTDPKQCIAGYEKVLEARLEDAVFFYEQDTKQTVKHFLQMQERVTFQQGLGSIQEKTHRIEKIMSELGSFFSLDQNIIKLAALWCKFDLLTDMVTEFTNLQGVMGGIYAKYFGAGDVVANAISDHYHPRFSGDRIPKGDLSCLLALADKADTLVGLFSLGKAPSGTKDPYSLRRMAQGIIRIMIEGQYSLSLNKLLQTAAKHYPSIEADKIKETLLFCKERFRTTLLDQGHTSNAIQAILAINTNPYDQYQRLHALESMQGSQDLLDLASANKRIYQLLKKNKLKETAVAQDLFELKEEKELFNCAERLEKELKIALDNLHYTKALELCSEFKTPVDTFFDQVLVMCEDAQVQNNRLALLAKVAHLCASVCQLDQLVNTKK